MAVTAQHAASTSAEARSAVVAPLAIAFAAVALVRLCTLGLYPLFDNTEARYAWIGQLMVKTGNWVTPLIEPDKPFWAKPPLSMWGTAISYAAFGVSEFSARLPSFLIFLAVAWLTYAAAGGRNAKPAAVLAALIFASCFLTFYLAGGVMTDPALMLGIVITTVAFWKSINGEGRRWGYVFFLGLAVSLLAKGPVGVVLPGVSIGAWVLWHNKWKTTWRSLPWVSGTLLTVLVAVPWYVLAEHRTPGFLNYFIVGEHFDRFLVKDWPGDLYGAARTRPLGTIWLYAFAAALPWSAVLVAMAAWPSWRRQVFNRFLIRDEWLSYLLFWMLAPLVFFSLAHAVLITYVAGSLPAVALLTGESLRRLQMARQRRLYVIAAIVPALFVAVVAALHLDPDSRLVPTQRNVVAAYRHFAGATDARLVYYASVPNSASFYTDGRAAVVHDFAALDRAIASGPVFVAIDARRYADVPAALKAKFETLGEYNSTLLLKPRAGSGG